MAEGPRVRLSDYDLVLWDLDGTLVDSRLDLVEATNVAMRALGYPLVPFDRFSRMMPRAGFLGFLAWTGVPYSIESFRTEGL